MAKPVIVNLNGATASFNPVKVDRSKIMALAEEWRYFPMDPSAREPP